jgi:hypothetical protein
LPGYEQQFIDNLVKRGVGSTNASTKHQQDNGHKQFKKFIDSSCNKPTSHLFTIFRMNPTSNGVQKRKKKKMSRVKNKTIAAAPVKYQLEQEDHDSDCDSGVDLGCGGPFPKERASPTKDYYSSLLESSLLEEDLFNLPSSIIMDSHQNLFDDVYWPQTQQTQYEPLDCYFDTSFNQQNYLLYNDILSSQNL